MGPESQGFCRVFRFSACNGCVHQNCCSSQRRSASSSTGRRDSIGKVRKELVSRLPDYVVRKATLEDRDAIQRLIADSARLLSREHYRDVQIESAIETVFGVDTDLINDGTYFVAEHQDGLVGCGGWSKRKTLFGGDQFTDRASGTLDPASEPAK